MKIPDKLKVGGITYKVIKKNTFKGKDNEFSGLANHKQTTIEIALTHEDEPYDTQKIEECFIHEILHCIDSVYNNQALEEAVINRLSQGLYQVLKDNNLYGL